MEPVVLLPLDRWYYNGYKPRPHSCPAQSPGLWPAQPSGLENADGCYSTGAQLAKHILSKPAL